MTTAHEAQLQRSEQEASVAVIDSRPSFLIDGERFAPEAPTIEAFRVALDAALKAP